MSIRERLLTSLARQFGRPEGFVGRLVALAYTGDRREVKAGVEALELRSGQTGADLGFGGGFGLRLLLERVGPGGRVHGVDVSQMMLRQAARQFRQQIAAGLLVLSEGSLTALPLADASLDGVLTANTVYFLDDLAAVCSELARVVRPGGRVAVVIADPVALAKVPFTAYGFIAWTAQDILEALERAGLVDVRDIRVGGDAWVSHVIVARRP